MLNFWSENKIGLRKRNIYLQFFLITQLEATFTRIWISPSITENKAFQLFWNQMTSKINSIIEGTKGIFRMLQLIMTLKYVLCCGFLELKVT